MQAAKCKNWTVCPSGFLIPDSAGRPPEPLIGLDLFAGCGGFSLGMELGGIAVACALEAWPEAAATYLHNLGHPGGVRLAFDGPATEAQWQALADRSRRETTRGGLATGPAIGEPGWFGATRRREGPWASPGSGCRGFFLGDVRAATGQQLLDLAQVDRFDIVFGGPPCQGLSLVNPRRCIEDPRNALVFEFLRLVEELEPLCFLIENVPPILSAGQGALFEAICDRANGAGYDVVADVLDASNYGVPQYRNRAFIYGGRAGTPAAGFQFPMPRTWGIGALVDGKRWNMLSGGKQGVVDRGRVAVKEEDAGPLLWEEGDE